MMQKHFERYIPIFYLPLVALLLAGCSEMEGQINSLKDKTGSTRDANNEASIELQKLNQELSLANQKVRSMETKRAEFAAKSTKSAATERIFVNYRADLEKSLAEFTASVADYRKKYLVP